jgi:hypothetical protein
MAEKIIEIDTSIRDYLNNNKFLTDSSWANVAITQLFRVDVVTKNRTDASRQIALGNFENYAGNIITIQDVT